MQLLLRICFSAFLLKSVVSQTCDRNTGPAGTTECVSFSTYSGKQYATCLTNIYIQRKSSNRHICRDRTATFCWYQCMIEHYDIESGIVNSVCSCDGSSVPTSASVPYLPAYCYSPSGEDCTWYTNCLEKKYPCGAETGYALAFGKKYCEQYAQNYGSFSSDLTRRWVDATRQCLQLVLVPLIRSYVHPTCDAIKKTALDSHVGCYTSRSNPYANRPSICDLVVSSPLDLLRILWTIKGSFVESDFKVLGGTWGGFVKTLGHCAADLGTQAAVYTAEQVKNKVMSVFEGTLKLLNRIGRKKRSITDTDPAGIAVEYAGALSSAMKWTDRGIQWLPLLANYTNSSTLLVFRLLIGGRDTLAFNGTNSFSIDMNAEMESVKTKVRSGIRFELSSGQFYLSQMSDCTNSTCQEKKSITMAPENIHTTNQQPTTLAPVFKPLISLTICVWVALMRF